MYKLVLEVSQTIEMTLRICRPGFYPQHALDLPFSCMSFFLFPVGLSPQPSSTRTNVFVFAG